MKLKTILLFVLLLIFSGSYFSQVTICSWNIQNFGKSKTDSSIRFIANTVKDFDVLAIVEVVAGNGGAQAVARLADELNRKGSKWDYCVSDPTFGETKTSERYAFIWKTHRIKKKGDAWLDTNFKREIEREPYMADFIFEGKEFTLASFHALPKSKQPEIEIKYFRFLPAKYPGKALLFSGDFNCPESHNVFTPLKEQGFKTIFSKQKTTLKTEPKGEQSLASEYDNIFYDASKIKIKTSGVVHFYKHFPTLKEARRISDHLPIYCEITVN